MTDKAIEWLRDEANRLRVLAPLGLAADDAGLLERIIARLEAADALADSCVDWDGERSPDFGLEQRAAYQAARAAHQVRP